MCGLAGELRFDGRPADVAALARMTGCLEHRGPDGSGIWARGPVGLGHRRLSIIDLSDTGAQPLVDPVARLTVVFETTRAGLHIDAWVPTAEGTDVPRDGFGWAVLQTLADNVEGRAATQADVPGGDGTAEPVAVISMDKYLPGKRPPEAAAQTGQNLSVTQ